MTGNTSDGSPHRRLQRIGVVSARLKPLACGDRLKLRRDDIAVFAAAAEVFDHIIIVRAINERSLPYIGHKRYAPKPIDCKPKTADNDAYLQDGQRFIECAGLVVDPTLVGASAFASDHKRNQAAEAWAAFLKDKSIDEVARKVYRRRGSKGFYAVDLLRSSRRYGCLMLSQQDIPAEDFSTASREWAPFRQTHLRYLHADYDLYGLIDLATLIARSRPGGPATVPAPKLLREELHGTPHYYTEKFPQIQQALNRGFGVPMIQHAAQDSLAHQSGQLYVFYPEGYMYQINASLDAIREIYALLFTQDTNS